MNAGRCSNSGVQYGVIPPRDESTIDSQQLTLFSGLNLPQAIDKTTLKFQIPNSPLFLDPLQIELELKLQIVKENGDKMTEPLMVVPACSMFSVIESLEVWSRGKRVRTYSDYNYLEHVIHLYEYKKDFFETLGTISGWLPDAEIPEGAGWAEGGNAGATARRYIADESRIFTQLGRLWIPMLTQSRYIPADQENNWEVHLNLASSNFVIQKGYSLKDQNFKMLLHEARLHVTKVQFEPGLQLDLMSKRLSFPVVDYDTQQYVLWKELKERTLPPCSLSKWPTRLWIFFIEESAAQDQLKNSYWMQHFDVESIEVSLGSRFYKLDGMSWDLESSFQAANAYYQACRKALNSPLAFGLRDFMQVNTCFVFDCTNTRFLSSCPGMVSVPDTTTDYSVSVKFKNKLEKSVVMRVISEFDNVVEIEPKTGDLFIV